MTSTDPTRRCPRCGTELTSAEAGCPRCFSAILFEHKPSTVFHGPTSLTSPIPSPWPRLGDYQLLEEIARGGMGIVYRARQISLDRVVALKLMRDRSLAAPEDLRRFRVEALAAAKLKHPHIVAIYDVGEEQGQPYLAMDFVEGIDLAERARQGPLPAETAAEIVEKIARAVQHAHEQGVLHRDLKPSNVLIDARGEPFITDFGLARPLDADSSLTLTGQVLGTPAYMPPEQASGHGTVGPAADIYSLGALLYHLLTGRAPFVGSTAPEILRQVMEQEPVSPQILNPATPRDLASVCLKCLAKRSRERYASALELAQDLRRFLQGDPTIARPTTPTERLVRWCRRKPALAGLSVVSGSLLLAVLIGTPIVAWRINEARENEQGERQRAQAAEATARHRAYAAEIHAAFQALEENSLDRARQLLDQQRPQAGEPDLRGFEWRYLWQSCRGHEAVTFHDESAQATAFSPDQRFLAYADDGLVIRNASSYEIITNIPVGTTSLSFSPAGHLLAGSSHEGATVWSTADWNPIKSLPGARLPSLFSPDGRWLVTGAEVGFRVWDAKTWQPVGDCPGAPQLPFYGRAAAFSPNGQFLVTLAGERWPAGDYLRVWRVPELDHVRDLHPQFAEPSAVALTPDGVHLVAGLWDGRIVIWDFESSKVVASRLEHTGWVTAVAMAADGRTFATASADRSVILWDTATCEPLLRRRGHVGEVWSLAIAPDGKTLLSGARDGTTKLWRLNLRSDSDPEVLIGPTAVAGFIPGNQAIVAFATDRLWVWTPETETTQSFSIPFRGVPLSDQNWGRPFSVTPDGSAALRGNTNGTIEVWSLTSGQSSAWPAHSDDVCAIAFSNDGQLAATSSMTGEIKIWEFPSRRVVGSLRFPGVQVNQLAMSRDGTLLAASGFENRVWLWDWRTGREFPLEEPEVEVACIALSPDNRCLAAGTKTSNEIILWATATGRRLAALKGHVLGIGSVEFSPDGRTLASGSMDRRVKLWSVATHQELVTFVFEMGAPSVSFSSDGRMLAIGNRSGAGDRIRVIRAPSLGKIAAWESEANQP